MERGRKNMFTVSDIYGDDIPDDTVFAVEHPLSHRPHFRNPFLVNKSRYLFDDEFREKDYMSNRVEGPHRVLPVLGNRVRAYAVEPPCNELLEHWRRQLGTLPIRYAELGDPVPHVCSFPLEDLPTELHAVDPDMHYYVHSKKFISEIDCPQPATLTQLKVPSVLKVGRACGSDGTWMIHKEEDYHYWMAKIRQTMPHAETFLTEMVLDIKYNLCCHMYLNRDGEMKWLAVTEQVLKDGVMPLWIGAVIQMSRQDELERLVRSTVEPVSAALHARGFFGLFGVDVLVDSAGGQFVIDINPRILGSTPLVFSQISLQKSGQYWDVATFQWDALVKASSVGDVIERAEAISDGEVIIYSIIEKDTDVYKCQMGVFSQSLAGCSAIAESFQ